LSECAVQGVTIIFSFFYPAGKAGGIQSQGAKGAAVVIYCKLLATPELDSSGFPARVKNMRKLLCFLEFTFGEFHYVPEIVTINQYFQMVTIIFACFYATLG